MGAVVITAAFKVTFAKMQEHGEKGTNFTDSIWAPVNEREHLKGALKGNRKLLVDRSKGVAKGHSGN